MENQPVTAVEVNNITKVYGKKTVVDGLSFSANYGEILGLIGPNGAGKTTTIRIMMDIIKPDSGEIRLLGNTADETSKNKIGYLPEERGLYKKLSVLDSIAYLASLKGIESGLARDRATELLERVNLLAHKDKKIETLSRGMGQIVQLLVSIVHDPRLVILDEPFAGLDPVNTELLKEIILELRNKGKAVILSTHRMNEVEELCDRILMINMGRRVLYGNLDEIKARYRSHSVILNFEGELGQIPGVTEKRANKGYVELVLDANTTPEQVLERLVSTGIVINRFEVATPSLNEIFLEVVSKNHE